MHSLVVCIITVLLFVCSMNANEDKLSLSKEEQLKNETKEVEALSFALRSLYDLPINCSWKEVTQDLLNNSIIKEKQKHRIRANGRKIFVFSYPSDGLRVKGIVSIVPEANDPSTVIVLRGGNRLFGLPNPALDLFNIGTSTCISTCYRDGVSEGIDEFGGGDVADVKHLVDYIPEIEKKSGISIKQENMYLIGRSRGGMQMFLALARFPGLQNRFSKVVSLSGLLDLSLCVSHRSDMRQMFIKDFGLVEKANVDEWINYRNPLNTAGKIRKDLPILIIQGTEDLRVSLEEGYHMLQRLENNGNNVTYLEIAGGDHCLTNQDDIAEIILDWLRQ